MDDRELSLVIINQSLDILIKEAIGLMYVSILIKLH